MKLLSLATIGLLMSNFAFAQEKNKYHLFNPTPKSEMRGLNTDRPDKTESPYTVDAGHFQFETDLITQSYNNDDGVKTTTTFYNNINLKAGLTNTMDLQVVLPTYIEEKVEGQGESATKKGFGDTVIRLKKNLYGNDNGNFAVALMPYVKLPTAGADLGNNKGEMGNLPAVTLPGGPDLGNGRVEGGIIVPVAFGLPSEEWSMGMMLQIDHLRNEEDTKSQTDYVMSWTVGRALFGNLAGFAEIWNKFSDNKDKGTDATLDVGLTYGIEDNWQIDAGYFYGMTHAADDGQYFLGLTGLF